MSAHSEYGKLKSIFIKTATAAFINQPHIEKHWEPLNYLGAPIMQTAVDEYAIFETILKEQGATVLHFPEDVSVNMDSIYCRDAAIATNKGMIICNMGKAGRVNEPAAEARAFEQQCIPILGTIVAPGTLEGGDVAWIDENTLAVGHTYRTNEEGIKQLTELLAPLGVKVITVPMPHYKGPTDVFHLMSVLSPVDANLAVVAEFGNHRAFDGLVEIGIIEHDEGRVAPELHRAFQHLIGGLTQKDAAHFGRSGEGQFAHKRIFTEFLADVGRPL